ncbi:MAG: hypothetical protein IVW57_13040 [Ktedonobacterales bacterium]|nr:hypothetical protein [Ktedonobacterales bacterium]
MFRVTTMRRAISEGVAIFVVGRLVAMVPASFWPFWLFPLVLVGRVGLFILPPVWATMRVKSTKREKMSRRFWRLGPLLAGWCMLADALIALAIGEATLFGGPASAPDITRFTASGDAHLSPVAFVASVTLRFVIYAVYYTIAVVCTRLANGGFLRFTMPAGKGRVTL